MKYLAKEEGWRGASRYLVKATSVELILKETANALRTKVEAHEASRADVASLLSKVSSIVRFVDQRPLLAGALEVALEHGVTVYDAIFIEAARRNGMALVTCDARQAAVARELGVEVETA